jgi:hypothetical protein
MRSVDDADRHGSHMVADEEHKALEGKEDIVVGRACAPAYPGYHGRTRASARASPRRVKQSHGTLILTLHGHLDAARHLAEVPPT